MAIPDTTNLVLNNLYAEHTPKQVAVMIVKRGYSGAELGIAAIYDRLTEIFGKNHPDMPSPIVRDNAIRTVRRWVEGVEYEGLDVPYDPDEQDVKIKSYVHRLAILKAALLEGDKLTVREATHAKRILVEFEDPHGHKVDLIAQYAVLWELAEREATGIGASDIEDLIAYAPWVSEEASQLYRLAFEKKHINSFANLRMLAPLLTPGSGNAKVPSLFIGAHAQLNLPYVYSWRQEQHDRRRGFDFTYRDHPHFTEHDGQKTDAAALRSNCNWREFIKLKLNDAPTETVTVGINREDQEPSND